jgi:single-stranded-DNA-specific exonuclease
MQETRARFLNIHQSARGLAWVARLDQRQENIALAIAQGHGVDDVLARILAGRGVRPDDLPAHLEPALRDLMPDPRTLTGMQAAASRIADAVQRRETIAIFGDYDVDGACSSALLHRFLAAYGLTAEIYIPDRVFEGYGPNSDAMRALAARGARLIVTVDCGTNSTEPIAAANEAGADVVVLDHHQVGGPLPAASAIVNPNRQDDVSGQGHLCAAGVVFLALVDTRRALRERGFGDGPDLMAFTDLVALATVCDVVPLIGLNRAFVQRGLAVARAMGNPGLAALARVSRIGEPLNPFHFGFLIGPRINAGGRIGDAALGARLLSNAEGADAERIAGELDRLNAERQEMERVMLEQAEAEATAEFSASSPPAIVVTANDRWHPGIAGLIAARLKEKFRRPAFAIAFDATGRGTGSGRSVSGFDLGKLVRDATEAGLLLKGGGHAMAAGLTVEKSKLGALRAFMEERASDEISRLIANEVLEIDAAIIADAVSLDLVGRLDKAGPFGAGNPQPVFVLPQHRIIDLLPVGSGHFRVSLQSATGGRVTAMAFRAAGSGLGDFLVAARGQTVHAAGTLGANWWNGRATAQFRLIDAAKPN